MRSAVVALTLVLPMSLALGACSGGSDEPGAKASPSAPATDPNAAPTTPAPTGTPVPEALSRFRCDPDGTGTFAASGVVANSAKAAVTFQVTVYVGEPSGAPQAATTKQVPKVAGGGSAEFAIEKIPAPAEGGTCHVQVITTK